MFGFLKNLTPEGKLENEIKQSLESAIVKYIKDTGKNEFLNGFAVDAATRSTYDIYMTTAKLLSRGHGISYEKTVSIISKTTNEIRNKYLVNPLPMP